MMWLVKAALRGIALERQRRREDADSKALVTALERQATRIFPHRYGSAQRVYEMADGRLLTVWGEGWATLPMVTPISEADAEDYYGWTPA